jgi:hypothetical protein
VMGSLGFNAKEPVDWCKYWSSSSLICEINLCFLIHCCCCCCTSMPAGSFGRQGSASQVIGESLGGQDHCRCDQCAVFFWGKRMGKDICNSS